VSGRVALVARREDALAETVKAVRAAGADALPLALHLRVPSAAQAAVASTIERFGGVDALVNIAGAVPQVALFAVTDGEWDDGLSLKFHGPRRLTLAAWPSMRARGGSVVLISGTSAEAPKATFAAGRCDQRGDSGVGQGLFGARREGGRAGQQRPTRPGHDRTSSFHAGSLRSRPRSDARTGNPRIRRRERNRALRRAVGRGRTYRLSRIAIGTLDHRRRVAGRRWRDEGGFLMAYDFLDRLATPHVKAAWAANGVDGMWSLLEAESRPAVSAIVRLPSSPPATASTWRASRKRGGRISSIEAGRLASLTCSMR
jgi:hypothetical protein